MQINEDNFDKETKTGNAVVDFSAVWCAPCKVYSPIFHKFAEEQKVSKVKFGTIDVDKKRELAEKFEIMSVPTTIFFKEGKVVEAVAGVMNASDLEKRIKNNFG